MTEEKTERKPDIKLSQLIAAALAAITAAFLGSRLGVAGTVIGAGVASIVSTVAGALYQHSLDRTGHSVRSRVTQARTGQLDNPADPVASTVEETVLVRPPTAPRRRPRWGVAAALTALVFVIGMGAVTGVELLKNGPISGGDNGTTIGSLFGQPTQRSTTTPPPTTPSPSTTTTPPTTTAPPTTTPTTTTTTPPTSTTTPTTTAPPSPTTQP
jgi:hypothetical protein